MTSVLISTPTAMERAGLGLAILAEVRSITQSMKKRVRCYKQEGDHFEKVNTSLSRITKFADAISAILEASPILDIFTETLGTLKAAIRGADRASEIFRSLNFSGSNSDCKIQAVTNKARRFLKAQDFDKILNDLGNEASNVAGILQHQLSQLFTALKMDKMECNVRAMPEDMRLPAEKFRRGFNAPALSGKARLYFESHDAHGYFFAPEGTLRSLVLNSTNLSQVTVARGAPFAVHGESEWPAWVRQQH